MVLQARLAVVFPFGKWYSPAASGVARLCLTVVSAGGWKIELSIDKWDNK